MLEGQVADQGGWNAWLTVSFSPSDPETDKPKRPKVTK
jgi:hypothetical protein